MNISGFILILFLSILACISGIGGGDVLGASTIRGQVLGTSTMAKTGAVEDALFNSIFTLGSLLTSFGIMKNGKKKIKS